VQRREGGFDGAPCGSAYNFAMLEAELTAVNHAAIKQWTDHPCGALERLDESGLAFFEAVEPNRYEAYAP
jgi:hypothetical protein